MPSADDLRAMKDSPELRNRRKVRAAFVVLVRDEDLWEMTTSMQQLEDRFNHWAQYDWVFLNDGDFSDQFKRYTQALTGAKCKYGKIAPEVWNQPEW
jgi:alpha 1,2-mannosyltransferase